MPSNSLLLSAIRCFNTAAICALAVWHGYAFYLQQAVREETAAPVYVFTPIATLFPSSASEATL